MCLNNCHCEKGISFGTAEKTKDDKKMYTVICAGGRCGGCDALNLDTLLQTEMQIGKEFGSVPRKAPLRFEIGTDIVITRSWMPTRMS